MLFKLFATVAIFFEIFFLVFTALNDEQQDRSNYKILPLIYVHEEDYYHHPTNLLKKVLARDGQSFSSGTLFTFKTSREQAFFCPPDTDAYENDVRTALTLYEKYSRFEEHAKDLIFSKYCQFERSFEIGDPMTCPTEANPALRKITEKVRRQEQDKICGSDNGKLYEFFYMACPKLSLWKTLKGTINAGNNEFRRFIYGLPFTTVKRDAYQFCYDHNKMETIYTKYRLIPTKLFFNEMMKFEENKDFPFRTEEYEYFGTDFEKIKRAYDKVANPDDEKLNFDYQEPSTSNIPTNVPQYKLHQLTSATHFSLAVWKKATFHYANVRPMQKNLIDLWNHIDDLILYNANKENVSYEIYTGAFNVPGSSRPIQYMYKDHVEIPEIWVKIVHNSNFEEPYLYQGIAITMKNYELEEYSISDSEADCPDNLCFSYLSQEVIQEVFPLAAHQICCQKVTKEILNFFQIRLQSPYVLVIDALI